MFAQTTHVVAAPHGFACVVIPAARLYIPSFIEIRSGVSEPQGVKIWLFPLLWLVAFTTACTTVQAVIYFQQLLEAKVGGENIFYKCICLLLQHPFHDYNDDNIIVIIITAVYIQSLLFKIVNKLLLYIIKTKTGFSSSSL